MSEHLDPKDAAGLVMLAPGDAERARAEAHATSCPSCAAELAAARRALESLSALEAGAAASPERLRAVQEAVQLRVGATGRASAGGDRRVAAASALAAVACAVLAAAIFRGLAESALSWVTGGAALVLGLGAMLTVHDEASGRASTLVASAGALVLAMLSIEPAGGVEWEHAAYCGGTQLVGALAPVAVALWLPSAGPPRGWTLAGRGAGGALVTLSALSLVCPAHSALHVLGFHVLSVGTAAAVAAAVGSVLVPKPGR